MGEFNQKEFNDFVLNNDVIGFFEKPVTFKSGRICNCYVNWRNVAEDAYLMEKLVDFVVAFTKDLGLETDSFYGVPEGATKVGILTQQRWAKQSKDYSKGSHVLAMGRAKPKDHGDPKDKFFVGMPRGKTIVIEDVTTTGGSLIDTLKNLKESNVEVIAVLSLTNRMEKRDDGTSVEEVINSMGVPYYALSNALELIPLAYKKLNPGEEIKEGIEDYYKKYGIEELRLNEGLIVDKLLEKIDEKQNPCVVGLDPVLEKIPKYLVCGDSFHDIAEAFRKFNFDIIDAVYDLVPAVKPQIAFYEKYGPEGLKAFKDTVDYAKSKGLIVIEDGKRNDISSTAQAYADGHLGMVETPSSKSHSINVDILTVTPYLGTDGLKPFVDVSKEHGKGIFVLVKTSNPSSGEFQDRLVDINDDEKKELEGLGVNVDNKTELYNLVALHVNRYAQQHKGERGYSSIGAVVGATYPQQAEVLRKIMPNSFFLVPGYGAQGGTAKDLVNCFNEDGYGAVVNSSRGIIFAYEKYSDEEQFADAARYATRIMIQDIKSALKEAGKFPSKWEK